MKLWRTRTDVDLRKLNSLTKYPSILTYHVPGEKGRLTDAVQVPLAAPDLVLTEKVDGTNTRIVLLPDGVYVIGSREEFLYGQDDLIVNTTQNIVPTVVANVDLRGALLWASREDRVAVLFGEAYGHGTGAAAKQYSKTGKSGFRLFDVFVLSTATAQELLDRPLEELSRWRDGGGQSFLPWDALKTAGAAMGIPLVPEVVRPPLPAGGTQEVFDWIMAADSLETRCALEGDFPGTAEGWVVRKPDRSAIAKIRVEDYARARRGQGK